MDIHKGHGHAGLQEQVRVVDVPDAGVSKQGIFLAMVCYKPEIAVKRQ